MLKAFITTALLALSINANAESFMPESEILCGNLKVDRIYCFKAPCPQPLRLYGASDSPVHLITENLKLQAKLEARNGRPVCVVGYENEFGSFSVLNILRAHR